MRLFSRGDHHKAKGRTVTFVENEQLASADDRTCQRQNLSLTDGEITAAARNLTV
jgi:hypothetical protein